MGQARTRLRASVLAWLVVVTSGASAQTPTDAREARRLFAEGEQAYRLGRYEESIRAWEAAYAADPRPRIQYNLAQAHERLGRLEEAVRALEVFLASSPEDEALANEARARLEALRSRVLATAVRIIGGPVGADLRIDDRSVGVTPLPNPISVSPGPHAVAAVLPNGRRLEVSVVVPVGQVVDVPLASGGPNDAVIDVRNVSSSTLDGPEAAGAVDAPRRGHALMYTGFGVAGVGLGLGVYGIGRQVALGGCDDRGFVCLNEDAVRRERTLGLALGAALLAGGATLVVVDLLRGRPRSGRTVQAGATFGSLDLEVTW